ncbi:hypothetical protein GGTG_08423 [Gaeumannomyces tritici R3-111a-1]|uniref:Uncharacterized protein n=1 Tax=Gaeumannomyces tritici (strain R3-111a-1) TaxID=644352 RepID=J3P4I6_GAET3|nr:hypothetical protein GGTG_08423 [Gaeumannomyces tritici R3-111a-1]EJT74583.1 hypothetical protein GGTG_08423 [Gaeumannomyces tritici R3-111a-1]
MDKHLKDLPLRRDEKDDMSDDDFDFDEEYFERTYRPLSNLPTPPPSSKNSSASQSPVMEMHEGELLHPALIGAAIHLVNLLPPSASLATPSVSLVQSMLARADLPEHTVALAVCILDSLTTRFSRNWRLSCPLAPAPAPAPAADDSAAWPLRRSGSKRHTLAGTGNMSRDRFVRGQQPLQLHIDSVNPEVMVLAAMMIAGKFTEDSQEPTRWYASAWGGGVWTYEQINVTERCIMESLGYRIMPLTAPDVLEGALSDMARAAKSACGVGSGASTKARGQQAQAPGWVAASNGCDSGLRREEAHFRSKSCGKPPQSQLASLQLTPTDTP